MSLTFPDTAEFSGLYQPCRIEADVTDLVIEGNIPHAICGTFYQVAPDPQYPPMLGNDIFFNGDGVVTAIQLGEGRASIKRRYVQTSRLNAQKQAHRSLNGIYRNIYTNDPLAAKNNTTANTTVIEHNGVLLSMKEDALPWALNLETLETLGEWDFNGQIKSVTFTAHPKIEPQTGNLLCFAYEAKGDGTPDIAYYEISASGELLKEIWFQGPYAAMIHDFAVTENHVIFPVIPLTVDVERMKAGGQHFQWQPDLEQLFGILPRTGQAKDVQWFYGPKNGFQGHTLNSFEKNGKIYVDMPVTSGNVFYFFPPAEAPVHSEQISSALMRWEFDLQATDHHVTPHPITNKQYPCEFPRCDERFNGLEYHYGFALAFDPDLAFDHENLGDYPFQFFNQLARIHVQTGTTQTWYPGDKYCFQEPIFIPRSKDAPEGDGWVACIMNDLREGKSELVILDTQHWENGPIARVKIPFRLRMSLHGNWSPYKG
ncbi:carotenoid cleavage dioxygenase-like enzyme [Acinetobacter baylyi]|uniref:Carotenoid cleavage dioxygenase-like enzyme n=1 Tax=Acinetobacter baylyi TaxID=202950 RepID=A0ABU0UXP6_ACIBI|nr:carotenoid oxygenase family protein [Acinetobacter baylyi]MDQ1209330.1 carotenoid cleavage dioxygenase-like enzyme [Acinetobacter baylyi]MDR6107077.1 carotenoid cleavage dioxygenase-like enzyme [Acinetobacter baylyi]MDR6186202.1 carotenoid cleavage dioxygenase-like enzyme [Acinetobacter baylyi]